MFCLRLASGAGIFPEYQLIVSATSQQSILIANFYTVLIVEMVAVPSCVIGICIVFQLELRRKPILANGDGDLPFHHNSALVIGGPDILLFQVAGVGVCLRGGCLAADFGGI